ncbi:hypothetical protein LF1_30950 [Rubripirellula obstinata]|uniref:Uncharacterized protein n=1 Tax=Rubripirellula obstinata TaxID=406547 RepID=A0A5B1CKZ7_9BACT|nr:hypothetical protein LF1_30950 [Rubripirellula obstinata]
MMWGPRSGCSRTRQGAAGPPGLTFDSVGQDPRHRAGAPSGTKVSAIGASPGLMKIRWVMFFANQLNIANCKMNIANCKFLGSGICWSIYIFSVFILQFAINTEAGQPQIPKAIQFPCTQTFSSA